MTLPASGQIAATDINTELALANGAKTPTSTLSLNATDARTLANVPSGEIAYSDFYGKSSGPANVTMVSWSPSSIIAGNSATLNFNFSRSTPWDYQVPGGSPSSGMGGPGTSGSASIFFPNGGTFTGQVRATPGGTYSSASITVSPPPPPAYDASLRLVSGAGGGGGGGQPSSMNPGGGGGGGSAGSISVDIRFFDNDSYQITVGVGGNGGAVGFNGQSGTFSTISGPGVATTEGTYQSLTVNYGGGGGSGEPGYLNDGAPVPPPPPVTGGFQSGSGGGGGGASFQAAGGAPSPVGYKGGNAGARPRGGAGGGGAYGNGEGTTNATISWNPAPNNLTSTYGGQGGRGTGDVWDGFVGSDFFIVPDANTPDAPYPDTAQGGSGGGGGGVTQAGNAPGGRGDAMTPIAWQPATQGSTTDRNARNGYGHGGGGGAVGQAGGKGSDGAARFWIRGGRVEVQYYAPAPGYSGDHEMIVSRCGRAPFSGIDRDWVFILWKPGTYGVNLRDGSPTPPPPPPPPVATVTGINWNSNPINQGGTSSFTANFDITTTYDWTVSGPGASPSSGSGGPALSFTQSISFSSSGTATVTVTPTGGTAFTSPTLTINAPPPLTDQVYVLLIGGGGGGGSGGAGTGPFGAVTGGGGGGSAGQWGWAGVNMRKGVGDYINIQIGLGGGGSTSISDYGGAGGTTSIFSPNGLFEISPRADISPSFFDAFAYGGSGGAPVGRIGYAATNSVPAISTPGWGASGSGGGGLGSSWRTPLGAPNLIAGPNSGGSVRGGGSGMGNSGGGGGSGFQRAPSVIDDPTTSGSAPSTNGGTGGGGAGINPSTSSTFYNIYSTVPGFYNLFDSQWDSYGGAICAGGGGGSSAGTSTNGFGGAGWASATGSPTDRNGRPRYGHAGSGGSGNPAAPGGAGGSGSVWVVTSYNDYALTDPSAGAYLGESAAGRHVYVIWSNTDIYWQ